MIASLSVFVHLLGQVRIRHEILSKLPLDDELSEQDKESVGFLFWSWLPVAQKAGLHNCLTAIEHTIGPAGALAGRRPEIRRMTARDALERLKQFDENFRRDTTPRRVLILDQRKAADFNATFGEMVEKAFPSATAEIKEANCCYALGLNTACVFHLMRSVEHGLRALVIAVGVTNPTIPLEYQEWNPLIELAQSRSRTAVDAWGRSVEQTNARQFFGRVFADLVAFKDDVRNVTMHTRRTYDEPGALSVRNRVKEWFDVLAAKVSEDMNQSVLDKSMFVS